MRVEDLEQIRQMFDGMIATLAGQSIEVDNPDLFVEALTRAARPTPPKRFKPAFEEAFKRRKRAEERGKSIPVKDLAQELTSYEYKRNPESAIRSMQRGIARIEAEHQQYVVQGQPSPYLSD